MSDAAVPQKQKSIPFGIRAMVPKSFLPGESQPVEDNFKEVQELKLKQDDVIICSYPKSGTHWVGNLVTRLLYGVPYEKFIQCFTLENGFDTIESGPSPGIYFSHQVPLYIPQEHLKRGGKIVLVLRNPKDVAVASFNHMRRGGYLPPSISWEVFFQLFLCGDVPLGKFDDYVLKWNEVISSNNYPNIIVILYEDLQTNGFATLKSLQEHLGTNHSVETLQEILDECSFGSLKQQANEFDKSGIDPNLADVEGNFVIYRNGKTGDWKNWFTVAQNEAFDTIIQERLKPSELAEKLKPLVA